MKKITLSAIVAAGILLSSTAVWADGLENQNINNMHNISKRPYQQLPDASAYETQENWVGAGMASGGANGKSLSEANDKHLRFHFLGKRPFMEKTRAN